MRIFQENQKLCFRAIYCMIYTFVPSIRIVLFFSLNVIIRVNDQFAIKELIFRTLLSLQNY